MLRKRFCSIANRTDLLE